MKRELNVVAALIEEENKILLCQRADDDSYGGLWEFPGGVIEEGESPAAAIEREIDEELGLKVSAAALLGEFSDEDKYLKINISLFVCHILSGEPKSLDCKDFGFFEIHEISSLDLAPADIKIIDFLYNP
jgi:8-oxo-dGTP diphosphatase